jgi:hypothetical protein
MTGIRTMKPNQIEDWALAVIERVLMGQPVEDVKVELKSEWPNDPHGAARRIAGHANAAHGEPILWLIGVDEKKKQVVGANYIELANWWLQVQSFFSELPPDLIHRNVPYDEKTVVALLFETERRPFVVKVPGGGPINLEVPWRDGTMARSAKRRELITMLTAPSRNPLIEVVKGKLQISLLQRNHYDGAHGLSLDLYITPRSVDRIVIPFHHCEGALRLFGAETPVAFSSIRFRETEHKPSTMIGCTATEVFIEGPVTVCGVPPDLATLGRLAFGPTAQVELRLRPSGSEVPVAVVAILTEVPPEDGARKQFACP